MNPFAVGTAQHAEWARQEAAVLDQVHAFLGRFVAYPSAEAHIAHTLWVAHTHLMDAWESTPRIAFLSPEPGSGKTRALEITQLLVPNSVEAVNVTPAYLFRKVGSPDGRPTILYDEIDTVFGPKAKDNEEIRGLLNAGHRKGAVAGRCVVRGKIVETEEISAYCAVALAGLGGLPDTILSRAVVIRMRRRAPCEQVEPYRRRLHEPDGKVLHDELALWSAAVAGKVTDAWPDMPDGITDRDADVWEPLLAIADAVGGSWPARARSAAVALVAAAKDSTPSLGVRLLHDLREAFGGKDAMSTVDILTALIKLEESPWADLRGKELDARGLAARLRQYDVKPAQVRIAAWVGKGYKREDMHDAWSRYLPPSDKDGDAAGPPAKESVTRATAVTQETLDVALVTDVTDLQGEDPTLDGSLVESPPPYDSAADVADVADVAGGGLTGVEPPETSIMPAQVPEPGLCASAGCGLLAGSEAGDVWHHGQWWHKGCRDAHELAQLTTPITTRPAHTTAVHAGIQVEPPVEESVTRPTAVTQETLDVALVTDVTDLQPGQPTGWKSAISESIGVSGDKSPHDAAVALFDDSADPPCTCSRVHHSTGDWDDCHRCGRRWHRYGPKRLSACPHC